MTCNGVMRYHAHMMRSCIWKTIAQNVTEATLKVIRRMRCTSMFDTKSYVYTPLFQGLRIELVKKNRLYPCVVRLVNDGSV